MIIQKLIKTWQQQNKVGKVTLILLGITALLLILQITIPSSTYPVRDTYNLAMFMIFISLLHYLNYIGKTKFSGSILCSLLSLSLGFYFYENIQLKSFDTAAWMLLFLVGITGFIGWLINSKKAIIISIIYNTSIVGGTLFYYSTNSNIENAIYQTIIVFLLSIAQLSNYTGIVVKEEKNQLLAENNQLLEKNLVNEQKAREIAESRAQLEEEKNQLLAENNRLLEQNLKNELKARKAAESETQAQIEKRQAIEAQLTAERRERQATQFYKGSFGLTLLEYASIVNEVNNVRQKAERFKRLAQKTLNPNDNDQIIIYGMGIINTVNKRNDGKTTFEIVVPAPKQTNTFEKIEVLADNNLIKNINLIPQQRVMINGLLTSLYIRQYKTRKFFILALSVIEVEEMLINA